MVMTMLEARALGDRARTKLRNVEVQRYKHGSGWAYRVTAGKPGAETVYAFDTPEGYERWLEEQADGSSGS